MTVILVLGALLLLLFLGVPIAFALGGLGLGMLILGGFSPLMAPQRECTRGLAAASSCMRKRPSVVSGIGRMATLPRSTPQRPSW